MQASMLGLLVMADYSPPSLLQLLAFQLRICALGDRDSFTNAAGASCGLERNSSLVDSDISNSLS